MSVALPLSILAHTDRFRFVLPGLERVTRGRTTTSPRTHTTRCMQGYERHDPHCEASDPKNRTRGQAGDLAPRYLSWLEEPRHSTQTPLRKRCRGPGLRR